MSTDTIREPEDVAEANEADEVTEDASNVKKFLASDNVSMMGGWT